MARIAPFQCCAAVIAGVFRSHIVCLTEFGKSHFRNFVRRWVMLRVSPAARSRCFGFRRGVFNSVVLPALVIGAVANAQEGAQAPQRQEHETLTAPAQPQQPASGPPAASEVLVPDATAGTTQLPPIVVRTLRRRNAIRRRKSRLLSPGGRLNGRRSPHRRPSRLRKTRRRPSRRR
jgi:hypothetical protein